MTKIIAFAGRKQSGKTTCSECVASHFHGAKIYNFADPLKQDICMNILGLSYDQCYGSDDQKNELVDCYWEGTQLTAREVMQFVGTNVFRAMQQNVWADATINKILKEQPPLAIIADCRFPNEVAVVRRAGGLVIKLTRNLYHSDHPSETALDEKHYSTSNFDLVVNNEIMSISEQNDLIIKFLQKKEVLL